MYHDIKRDKKVRVSIKDLEDCLLVRCVTEDGSKYYVPFSSFISSSFKKI